MKTRQIPPLGVGLILLTLSPAAQAVVPLHDGWMAHGSHEPDSVYDDPTLMWRSPPGHERNRVYFNVFTEQAYVWTNPNVGALGTRHETIATEYHEAILGRWVDCNQDGYVGMLETAVREYASELLLDNSICPPSSGPATRWDGTPNYNGWVTEFTPIGPWTWSAGDERIFRDDDARVWGDIGYPGEIATNPTCVVDRLPAGGARSTGRLLDHADCYLQILAGTRTAHENDETGHRIAEHTGVDAYLAVEALTGVPLYLPDDRWAGSAHPLDEETFGDENGASAVEVFDCARWDPIWITRGEPPGDDFDHLYLERLKVPEANPDGSLAATFVYARRSLAQDGFDGHSPCWYTGDYAYERNYEDSPYALVEGTATDVEVGRKDSSDWTFIFHTQARGSGLGGLLHGQGDAGAAPDLGLEPLAVVADSTDDYGSYPTRWYADRINLRKLPVLARASLSEAHVGLPHAQAFTFYAHVGADTTGRGLSLPGGSGLYGSAACGGSTSGIHNGWSCDRDDWYPEYPWDAWYIVRVGQRYELRDVDCYDGGNPTGIQLGLAAYGDKPCRR